MSALSIKPCPAPKCTGVDGNAVLTVAPMCAHHVGKVRELLREFPRLYDDLTEALLPSPRGGGDDVKITTSKTAPLPINADARAAQEDMRTLLLIVEATFRIATGAGFPPIAFTERGVICQLEGWARRNIDAILVVDVELGVDVLRLGHRCKAILGETPYADRPAVPCPTCGEVGYLLRKNGSAAVDCGNCSARFDFEDERLACA